MSVRRTAAALLAAGLLLSGCTDEPEPRFEPTESPSPTESSTAEPEAQTPEEFIREWVELDNDMTVSGETDAFRDASIGCDPCNDYADQVEAIYGAGGFIRTNGRTVVDVQKAELKGAYELTINSAPTRYKERAGGKMKSLPGGDATLRLVLRKRDGEWIVADEVQL